MKKLLLLFSLILLFTQINAQHEEHAMIADKPATHGMLLFGTHKIYASHLPMFHSPHNYQIILELEFSKPDLQKYLADVRENPNYTTYTIEPEKFVLPDMINNPQPFKVNFYRGHFERGGIEILKNISVKIVKVIYFKKFNHEEVKTNVSNFILFGNEAQQFLVHEVTNKPDFEQIIEVKANLNIFNKKEIFVIITLDNSQNHPIGISGNEATANENKLVLCKQLYLEFDDLKN
jgi:hypothetical protein